MAKSKKKAKASSKILFQELLKEKVDEDDDDEEMEPESAWDDRCRSLKTAIEEGLETAIAKADADDGSSFEEDSIGGSSDEENVNEDGEDTEMQESGNGENTGEDETDEVSGDDEEPGNEVRHDLGESMLKKKKSTTEEKDVSTKSKTDHVDDEAGNQDDNDEMSDASVETKNGRSSKALRVVTKDLVAKKAGWDWAETFDVVPSMELPFADKEVSIHDDLKREVAFYDMALEAVRMAKKNCEAASIPFSRPDDFFAEMVKTDGTFHPISLGAYKELITISLAYI